jgi:SAM-dependent methyltransferase
MSGSRTFDRAASFYDATRGFPPGVEQQAIAALVEATNLTPTSRVLEIGVGTGRIALPLSRHTGLYVGLDLARPMMEVLRNKQPGANIGLIEANASRLPLASQQFDLALAIHVFHLISTWREVIAELGRVVRPDGAVLFNLYNDGPDAPIIDRWNKLLDDHGYPMDVRTPGTRDMNLLGAALAEAGFTQRTDGLAAEWPTTSTPAETVANLANRIWSATWEIPEPIFTQAIADLRAWVAKTYPDPHQPLTEISDFRYALFQRPGK